MAQVVGIILYEPEAEDALARWLFDDVLKRGMCKNFCDFLFVPTQKTSGIDDEGSLVDREKYVQDAINAMEMHIIAKRGVTSTDGSAFVFFIIAVLWDGQCDASKAAFAQLRSLAEPHSEKHQQLLSQVRARISCLSSVNGSDIEMEVIVQALNAKKGQHSIQDNRAALIQSLQKKLYMSTLLSTKRAVLHKGMETNGMPTQGVKSVTTCSQTSCAPAPAVSAALLVEAELSAEDINDAVEKGQGETFYIISGPSREVFETRIANLRVNASKVAVACAAVTAEPREVQVHATGSTSLSSGADTSYSGKVTRIAQEFLLRRDRPGQEHLEMRLAMCGNVDSGKSTLTSVLTRGCHDDGRGFARSFVFKHKHEAITGRTSSISENYIGFTATGEVVNYQLQGGNKMVGASPAHSLVCGVEPHAPLEGECSDSHTTAKRTHGTSGVGTVGRQCSLQQLAMQSAKVLTLYDLAGHERYLKTTILGMTRNMPDYACVVISANNGIQRMTKEHLALCLALKLPFFIVITRIDATPENVRKETMANIHKLLKIPTVRRLPYPVRRPDELILAAKNLRNDRITPIFEVSNVTGEGISPLLQFLNLLPLRMDWRAARSMPKEMIIDSTFFVTGVGTVVGGVITQGVFRVNDTVLLGPDGFGHYRPVTIKSIHIRGVDSATAAAGHDTAFCLKKEKHNAIRKGNILADLHHMPLVFWQFEADITILYHSTTITTNYEPVIHSTTVRQSARVTYVAQEVLRTGDRSLVCFHFLYRPEFMREGQRLIFREGRTKGIGVVVRLIANPDNALLSNRKLKKKKA